MLLGARLPGGYADWRVVEDDLHDIAGRMREYDPDARLVRKDGTGHLGIAVERRDRKRLAFARELFDLDTDLPLANCPDGRVLRCLRAYDSRRLNDMRDWYRRTAAAERARDRRDDLALDDDCGDHAEHFVHALSKDVPAKPRAVVPQIPYRKVAA